ncbi:hypothetical protein CIG2463D_1118 [Campylobacter iguaniorum]|uniref:hypothetical protein n=1 Tax=Campylobacter iguaniorum TaxID=1244531 RepID=UPI00073A42D7|nr:hypothetical protein [Campylobacter iguaniorum]ALV24690.1 hypothetical protein CIG2463D_1118 [Campylobacter iguaniorum]
MRKMVGHFIYFNEADARVLTRIAKSRNESKSAIVRKLIHIEKYAQTLKQIEINNNILADFLQEFKHLGKNLNQIAYHLNAHIIKKNEAKSDLEKNMQDFAQAIEKLDKKISKLEIKIIEKTRTPSSNEIKGEENG